MDYLRRLSTRLRQVDDLEGFVGLPSSEGRKQKIERRVREDGTVEISIGTVTLAETAVYNEYGTDRIPARPVYRAFSRTAGTRALIAGLGLYLQPSQLVTRDPIASFESTGRRLLENLIKAIEGRKDPANAGLTVKQKGFDDPLINSGQFRSAQRSIIKLSEKTIRTITSR